MDTTRTNTATIADPQNDWQNAQTNASLNANPANPSNDHLRSAEANGYIAEEDVEERLFATEEDDDLDDDDLDDDDDDDNDDDDDDDDDEEEEKTRDWGHVDPAESNSPIPDSNAPSAPGSAV